LTPGATAALHFGVVGLASDPALLHITMMGNKALRKTIAVLLCATAVVNAHAAPPAVSRGELLFQTCTACHSVLGDGVGPDLGGIYGRKAGVRAGFNYSEALKKSGVIWNDATLRAFVRDPQSVIKGTIMTFPGYADNSDVEAVVSYLKSLK
jgi:cytochrome c